MNEEKLIKPRYKVIANYPYTPFEIGMILIPDDEDGELYSEECGYTASKSKVNINDVPNYPAVFKRLRWHEDIGTSILPQYLKNKNGEVVEVKEWCNTPYDRGHFEIKGIENNKPTGLAHHWLNYEIPNTKEIYDFLNKNKS